MTAEPYARARRVFWIVDNGSSHRGQVAADRLQAQWPNLVLVHLPFYASWLNQIEIVFSVIQRKVLTPNDFASLQAVVDRLDAFEHHYNEIAKPFEWTFTRRDLTDLIARVAEHEPRLKLAPDHDGTCGRHAGGPGGPPAEKGSNRDGLGVGANDDRVRDRHDFVRRHAGGVGVSPDRFGALRLVDADRAEPAALFRDHIAANPADARLGLVAFGGRTLGSCLELRRRSPGVAPANHV